MYAAGNGCHAGNSRCYPGAGCWPPLTTTNSLAVDLQLAESVLKPVLRGVTRCTSQAHLTHSARSGALHGANLAPAGTGTQTVADRLTALVPNSSLTHHNHFLRAGDLSPAGAAWFVVSVRDPVRRLQSGFRSELWAAAQMHGQASMVWATPQRTLAAFVRALRNVSDPSHNAARLVYSRSVAQPEYKGDQVNAPGSNFLTAQVDYLRGIDCAVGLHFLCVDESLDDDWARFVRSLGLVPLPGASTHANRRSGGGNHTTPSTLLDPVDAAFVREQLFPWDAAFHRLACGSNRGIKAR